MFWLYFFRVVIAIYRYRYRYYKYCSFLFRFTRTHTHAYAWKWQQRSALGIKSIIKASVQPEGDSKRIRFMRWFCLCLYVHAIQYIYIWRFYLLFTHSIWRKVQSLFSYFNECRIVALLLLLLLLLQLSQFLLFFRFWLSLFLELLANFIVAFLVVLGQVSSN